MYINILQQAWQEVAASSSGGGNSFSKTYSQGFVQQIAKRSDAWDQCDAGHK